MPGDQHLALRLTGSRQHGHHIPDLDLARHARILLGEAMLVEGDLQLGTVASELRGDPLASGAYAMRGIVGGRKNVSGPEGFELPLNICNPIRGDLGDDGLHLRIQ